MKIRRILSLILAVLTLTALLPTLSSGRAAGTDDVWELIERYESARIEKRFGDNVQPRRGMHPRAGGHLPV